MDLRPLIDDVAAHLDDETRWAVLADALQDHGEPVRGAALAAELSGVAPGVVAGETLGDDPHAFEWFRGFWRSVRVQEPLRVDEVLVHPAARLLQEIEIDTGGDPSVPLPRSLHTASVTHDQGRLFLPALLAQVSTLEIGIPFPGPLASPVLCRLTVRVDQARWLHADALPALRRLVLREEIGTEALSDLLSTPLGRQLEELEVEGEVWRWAEANRSAWAHLRSLVIDGEYRDDAPEIPGLLQRSSGFGGSYGIVRLLPPALRRTQMRAFRTATRALGLRMVDVPNQTFLPVSLRFASAVARRMAAVSGFSAEMLTFHTRRDGDHDDPDAIGGWVEGRAFDPDGISRPADSGASRWEVSDNELDDESRPEWIEEYVVDAGWAYLDVAPPIRTFEPLAAATDPWVVDGPPAYGPRRLVAGDEVIALDAKTGGYLAWRILVAGVVARVPPPDLSRWAIRLSRRHGLAAPPSDRSHPYWAEWAERTAPERGRAPDAGKVASFKILHRGQWVLHPQDLPLLRNALTSRPEVHREPSELDLSRVRALFSKDTPVEVLVA